MKRAALAVLAFTGAAAFAQDRPDPWELRVEAQRDNLDNGYADWKEIYSQLTWRPRRGLAAFGGARQTERFDLKDTEGFGGAYLPLASRTTLHFEGSASGTHRVLPEWMALAEISQVLGEGWVASIAAKKTRFTQDDTATAFATIEKYVGEWRLAYTGYITRLEGGSWSPTHRGTASWNRGDFNYVTFNAARGREVENVVPVGLVTSDVTTYSIGAGIEIAARWGLTFEWAHQKQGDLYTRRSARLGTRLAF